MSIRLLLSIWMVVGSLVFLSTKTAWAQVTAERLEALRPQMDQLTSFGQRLPAQQRKALSSGARNLFHVAETWGRRTPTQAPTGPYVPLESLAVNVNGIQISDPSTDFAFSRLAGFTQNETSGAWCGNNVVIGFNDSGSFEKTLPIPGIGLSFNGFAQSTNRGHSFTDLDFLPPGTITSDFLVGDPVLVCANATTFYYASLFLRFGPFTTDISVSKSTNGGATFANPVSAVHKDLNTHFLDKEWLAIDPTNTSRLFVTYTDFDFSGTSVTCGADFRTAIELVQSTDGGSIWSTPIVIREVCGFAFVQGSQVLVGPDGAVYVAWEDFAADFVTRALFIRKSTNHGSSFSAPVQVDSVTPVGGLFCAELQGFVRNLEFPSLTVRNSDNLLLIAWNDGRNHSPVTDSLCDSYRFADIRVRFSSDGGATWPGLVAKLNDNTTGTDVYQPTIAVDQTNGTIGVCWYDRRNSPTNSSIDRYCAATGINGNVRITPASFPVVVFQDFDVAVDYQGDYDTLVTEFTKTISGFILVWGDNLSGNADVVGLSTAP